MTENSQIKKVYPEIFFHFYRKKIVHRVKELFLQIFTFVLICSFLSIINYLSLYYKELNADEPPVVSQVNNELFVKKYVNRIHNANFGGAWYQIREIPQDVFGSWEHDDQLLNLQFSNPEQIDINKVRLEYYHLNIKQTQQKCSRMMLWIWIIGIGIYLLLKIKKSIYEWWFERETFH